MSLKGIPHLRKYAIILLWNHSIANIMNSRCYFFTMTHKNAKFLLSQPELNSSCHYNQLCEKLTVHKAYCVSLNTLLQVSIVYSDIYAIRRKLMRLNVIIFSDWMLLLNFCTRFDSKLPKKTILKKSDKIIGLDNYESTFCRLNWQINYLLWQRRR